MGVNPIYRLSLFRRSICLIGILLAGLLGGCGILHGSAQIGSNLKPRLGTSISVPLGK
jgi:hypothetical protein